MGLYPIDCVVCKKPFMWFSGSLDHRCAECQQEASKKADVSTALEDIRAQLRGFDARIEELKRLIEKPSQPVIAPDAPTITVDGTPVKLVDNSGSNQTNLPDESSDAVTGAGDK